MAEGKRITPALASFESLSKIKIFKRDLILCLRPQGQSPPLPMESLITHTFPLDQIQEAFDTNLRQEGVKIMIEHR